MQRVLHHGTAENKARQRILVSHRAQTIRHLAAYKHHRGAALRNILRGYLHITSSPYCCISSALVKSSTARVSQPLVYMSETLLIGAHPASFGNIHDAASSLAPHVHDDPCKSTPHPPWKHPRSTSPIPSPTIYVTSHYIFDRLCYFFLDIIPRKPSHHARVSLSTPYPLSPVLASSLIIPILRPILCL
jgi:hypothetical protein